MSFKRNKTTLLFYFEKRTPLRKGKCFSRFVEVQQNGHTVFHSLKQQLSGYFKETEYNQIVFFVSEQNNHILVSAN